MGVKVAPLQFIVLVASFAVLLVASDTASNGWTAPSNNSSKYKAECPSGWVLAPNKTKCFGYNESLESWDESEIHCKRYHGHLAALTSFEELNFAQHLCGQSVNGCWVGGRVSNSTISSGWKWSDNTSVWNESVLRSSAQSICPKSSCIVNNSVDLCTLVKNGSEPFVSKRCNASRAFLCMVDIEDKCYYMHCHKEYLIILAVVSGLVLFTTFAVVVWLLAYKRSKRRRRSRKLSNPDTSALVPPSWKIFTSDELRSITKNFSEGNRLHGDAKTGSTYSGLLPDGSKAAVKRLKRSSFQRKKEFYSEIGRVAKLRHPNLVAVKGCCYDHGDRYIVYEFITNGPLDRWLYHIPRGGRSLDWTMRIKIATTLAQGIAFLHDKVKPHVVHRDIRASNVLLDEEFGAHLMGVGLSKIVPWEVMHERTVMAGGTYGYLAPEFVYRNELTTKSDVYSFGVLLLEIVSGRRPAQQVDSVGWQSIFEWATPLVQAHHYPKLLDPLISSSTSDIPEAGDIQKVVDLVYACTQNVPSMRPRMSHVVHQLQQLAQPALAK
ncbi:C-type lectin receptor-like tyrosine-protein kinase At1g52310 isoform X2 [Gossypium hirsutum]|uniref:C-type lectin receptor-like tyrosine-protein kinase At1g52310 isoform X2 n=1 Tax=Gossypium hirsutum TaxID=3635 RepID=A0A1U8LA65_GOSHI|nr:C-type lectin receptor-like tyrosine-protein kinase At1g52310 isoform X2 [Gossypium hirsutum]